MFYLCNQVVRRAASVHLLAGAAVHGDGGDARLLGGFGDGEDVFAAFAIAEAGFQGNRHAGRRHHGAQDVAHQFLVLQQGTARQHIAHLLHGAAHVDVDDLRALFHVVTRRLGHFLRVAARNLHRAYARFTGKIAAVQAFFRLPQRGVAVEHLADRIARAKLPRQRAEGLVGNPRHRREGDGGVDNMVCNGEHGGAAVKNGARL